METYGNAAESSHVRATYRKQASAGRLVVMLLTVTASNAFGADPERTRLAARQAGLDALSSVPVPRPRNLDRVLNSGKASHLAVIRLGKALFWDMQVGSDGQACASCHFHAGADSRTRNQLSPGLKHRDAKARNRFEPVGSGFKGGPNHQLGENDFPFHRLADPEDRHSAVLFDSDDVASSQGVRYARFTGIQAGTTADRGDPRADPVFNLDGVNTRRVEPRNTPTVINAVFNFTNFWDGRASAWFNGVNGSGPLDEGARVRLVRDGKLTEQSVSLYPASLASQAVVPPTSDLEMSFSGRRFPDIGKKLPGLKPLGLQRVHPDDSVLGALSEAHVVGKRVQGPTGLRTTYGDLVRAAFRPEFWSTPASMSVGLEGDHRAQTVAPPATDAMYTQMEANFALFFGVALQL